MIISAKDISFAYTKTDFVLKNFYFEARRGEIILIKGKSGAGKSTLLKIFCGIIPKVIKGTFSGQVTIYNTDISKLTLSQTAPFVSLMFQDADKQLILPDVESELAFACENLCLPKKEISKRIETTLDLLQLNKLKYASTATLSFGQKKLVVFASIITLSPTVFLLDEPISGLSLKNAKIVIDAIKNLSKKGKTFILAGHSDILNLISDRIIEL